VYQQKLLKHAKLNQTDNNQFIKVFFKKIKIRKSVQITRSRVENASLKTKNIKVLGTSF